jgi:heme exporter protein A
LATGTSSDARSPSAAPFALQTRDLGCQRGGRLLFSRLNVSVSPGEAVWVRGPNGRGKTSLLRLLAGLSHPAEGQIDRGLPLVFMGHTHALKDDLSSQEALRFLTRLHQEPSDDASLVQALTHLGVAHRRRALVRTLSQGQRRRVALSRLALPAAPRTWILDEPFDALDDEGVATLNTLIQQHCAQGGAAVFTSHQEVNLPGLRTLWLEASGA